MNHRSWYTGVSLLIVILAIAVLITRSREYGGHFAEDAYITFRYARNLAEGHGVVWNIGEAPSEGYTSPLHVALLSAAIKVGIPVGPAALTISLLSIIGLLVIYWALLKRLGGVTPGAALVIAVYLIDARLAIHATAGLDTLLHAFMLAAAFLASWDFIGKPTLRAGVVLAGVNLLCLLTRPDAAPYIAGQALVLLSYAVYQNSTRRDTNALRYTFASYGVLVAVGSLYLGWKLAYFGYLLPNPFYLKSNQAHTLYGLESVTAFLKSLRYLGLVALPLLLFVRYSAIATWWHQPVVKAHTALLLVPVALFLAYYTTVIPEVNYASRFGYPTYFFFCLVAGMLCSLGKPTTALLSMLRRRARPSFAIAALGMGALFLLGQTYRSTWVYFPWFALVEDGYYRPIGSALARTGLGPEATIVFTSAGVVPFVSRFRHIDPVGLTDNMLSGRIALSSIERERYIWQQSPDVYIGPEPPAGAGATRPTDDPVIQTNYVQEVLLFENRFKNNFAYLRLYGQLSREQVADVVHFRMRELRDNWTLLGEIPYPLPAPKTYTTFAYVRNGSLHFDELSRALKALVTRTPREIDLDVTSREGEPGENSPRG